MLNRGPLVNRDIFNIEQQRIIGGINSVAARMYLRPKNLSVPLSVFFRFN